MTKEKNIPPFGSEKTNPFHQFKFPEGSMETLLSSYKKNMELITATHQLAADSAKSIMERQNEYCKEVFDQWNEQIKLCSSKAPLEEQRAHYAEASKETLDKTIKHLRELNSTIVRANEKIIESVQKRFKEGLDETSDLAKKSKDRR